MEASILELLQDPVSVGDRYWSDNYVTLDFETDTSHGDYGHPVHPDNGLLLACWKRSPGHPAGPGTFYSWGGEFEQQALIRDLEGADFIVAHNAKYEAGWLVRCGFTPSDHVWFDTKLAEYVLLGNLASGDKHGLRPRSTSLDACCRRRGWQTKDPIVDHYMNRGYNPVTIPRKWLLDRCLLDVDMTERLMLDQRSLLSRTDRLQVLQTRCLITPVLAEMEFRGMALDAAAVAKEFAKHRSEFIALSAEMDKMTGGINWRSGKQIGEFIYNPPHWHTAIVRDENGDPVEGKNGSWLVEFERPGLGFAELKKRNGEPMRTPAGKPKTDDKTLDKLVAKTPEQKAFIKLRKKIGKVNAALTKNLEFFTGVCKEKEEVFHAVFNQTSTATHRLSSSGIPTFFECFQATKSAQFQNLPNAFKYLFRAKREGWLIAEVDGSSLEWRVGGIISGDKQLLDDVVSGRDVHIVSASEQLGIPYEEVTPAQRKKAKPVTFRPMYGGKQGLEKYAEKWAKRYSGLVATQNSWCHKVAVEKRLITPWGLRYYFPHARVDANGYLNVKTSVYNYPIQALATAEIIPIAVVYLWHRIREAGLEDKIVIVNTVHDSVIVELHPDYVDTLRELAIQAFTRDVYTYLREVYGLTFELPLGIGYQVGERWSQGEEEKWNVAPDGVEERVT